MRSILKDNKYTNIYFNIIAKGLSRCKTKKEAKELLGYTEAHHIKPRCICTEEEILDKNNLVILTAREHFVAHLVLSKATDDFILLQKFKNAVSKFLQNRHGGRILTSWEYEEARKAASVSMSLLMTGRERSRESIDKAINTCIQRFGGGSSRTGAIISQEQRDLLSSIRAERNTYETWFVNADPEEKRKNHSEWAKKNSNFVTNNPSKTKEGAMKISLAKSKGTYVTPYGSFRSIKEAEESVPTLAKLNIRNTGIYDDLDKPIKTRPVNRASLPLEWKGRTWREVGFDFIPRSQSKETLS